MSVIGPEHWIERIQGLLADLDGQLSSLPDGAEGETSRQLLLGLRDKFVEGMAQLEAASLGADEVGDVGGLDLPVLGEGEEETTDPGAASAVAGAEVPSPPDVTPPEVASLSGTDLGGEVISESDLPPSTEGNPDAPFDDGEVTRSGP